MGSPPGFGGGFKAAPVTKDKDLRDKVRRDRERDAREAREERERLRKDRERAIGNVRSKLGEFKFDRVSQERPEETKNLISQAQNIYDKGFGAETFQAAREARLRGLQSGNLGQQRALAAAQARSGVAGGAAQQQLAGLLAQQQVASQQAERDLLLDQAGLKERGLGRLAQFTQGAQQDELGRQQFNIGLSGREALLQATPDILEAQLASAGTSANRQNFLAEQAKKEQESLLGLGPGQVSKTHNPFGIGGGK